MPHRKEVAQTSRRLPSHRWQHLGSVHLRHSEVYALVSAVVVSRKALWVVDPGFLPAEVDEIRHEVDRLIARLRPRSLYLLLTHADFDHIVGVHAFSDFQVVASPAASRRLPGRLARARAVDGELLLQRPEQAYQPFPIAHLVSESGAPISGATFYPAAGHTTDGLLARLEGGDGQRLLVAGDYLSALEGPHIACWSGITPTFETFAQLLGSVDRLVVGHGPAADQMDAWRRLAADAGYLAALLRRRADGCSQDQVLSGPPPPGPSAAEALRYHRDNVRTLFRTISQHSAQGLAERMASVACGEQPPGADRSI